MIQEDNAIPRSVREEWRPSLFILLPLESVFSRVSMCKFPTAR